MTSAVAPIALDEAVKQLLETCHLPTEDLHGAQGALQLFGCMAEARLAGVVGLQLYGQDGLLRSLAVAESARERQLGKALLQHAEQHARAQGVRTLYLLTTSAEAWFARHGYQLLDRGLAPASIAATRQFAGLCPAAAAFMGKRLEG
ncbi:arsenic resistance N-acetyltransferase ArsN2 [Pseudomonas borbori]